MKIAKATLMVGMGILFASQLASASVVIGGTRVVFPSNEREVSVRLTNEGKTPSLVQVWFDKGDPNTQPDSIAVPFVITPPLARIDPAKGQTLRIISTGEKLAEDRESIYWLNVLDIPPKPKEAESDDANYMQMAFRSRIKFFYRPKNLNKQELLEKAAAQVTWKLVLDSDKKYSIEATNPTAYHISFTEISVGPEASKIKDEVGGMISPFDKATFSPDGLSPSLVGSKIRYSYLNDYGASVVEEAVLSH